MFAMDWRGGWKTTAITTFILFFCVLSHAESGRLDYDLDDDGLIEINDLSDLNEIRNNLDGTSLYGVNTGCPVSGCNGFELIADLDFDTNQDGKINELDEFWNDGKGWEPIGKFIDNQREHTFTADFNGNHFQIKNLYIDRQSEDNIGLFGFVRDSAFENIGLTGKLMFIRGRTYVGPLAGRVFHGLLQGHVKRTYSYGRIVGISNVGGLIGLLMEHSKLEAVFTDNDVSGVRFVGGIVGRSDLTKTKAVYSVSNVSGDSDVGGLIGSSTRGESILASFFAGSINKSGAPIELTGGLIGSDNFGESFDVIVSDSYWALDTSMVSESLGATETTSYIGLQSQVLQCGVQANTSYQNSSCLSSDGADEGLSQPLTMYKDWDLLGQEVDGVLQPYWDFGSSDQLPALIFNNTLHRDSDGDLIWDEHDEFPLDFDNDGVDDQVDLYPRVSIGGLVDTDNDGAPNECDQACIDLGMTADNDDDNDGILDVSDTYPLVFIEGLEDTDKDGAPNECDQACIDLGMTADNDDDNDGINDVVDTFPLVAIGNLVDTDSDGAPNECDQVCTGLGMAADSDDDADKLSDEDELNIYFSDPLNKDSDGDGLFDGDEINTYLTNPSVADSDGDGVSDKIEVAHSYNPNDLNETPVMALFPKYVLQGESAGDSFGYKVSGAGDVNNDGYSDVIVNATRDNENPSNAGSVRVVSGYDGSELYTFNGTSFGFAISMSGGGDVNADGYSDIIIGHPYQWNQGKALAGKVIVFSGKDGQELYAIKGSIVREHFGISVADAGDVNGDGHSDIVVGNRPENGELPTVRVYSGVDGAELYRFQSGDAGDYFGQVLSAAGDINADGFDDIMVGAESSSLANEESGTVYIYSGKDGSEIYKFHGENQFDHFGQAVSSVGDINNDGYADVIIGAPYSDINGLTSGSAYVFSGVDGSILYTFNGEASDQYFGARVSAAGDINLDGFNDFIIGDRRYSGGELSIRVRIFSGNSGREIHSLFGNSFSSAGDVDRDSINDVIVGGGEANSAVVYTLVPDLDRDGISDQLDLDDDNDGLEDLIENILGTNNKKYDTDGDGWNDGEEVNVHGTSPLSTDSDGDGINDSVDVFPLISIGSLNDVDNDGAPSECDQDCTDLGMTADNDDDNDGLLDDHDAFSLVAIGELLDTDNDGAPNECDDACIDLGMAADSDDDNDGIADVADTHPLISIGVLIDTDQDGSPNDCDQACIDLGMGSDNDDDNDGIADESDAHPLISIGALIDTDNDGSPNDCDQTCLDLGMMADTDDDNDGIADAADAYPLIPIGLLTDTDQDGSPNDCDQACIDLGMIADTDDDNDGIADASDDYPLISIGQLTDTDQDGSPNDCDQACIDLGMIADTDDDNDGIADASDGYPLISIGQLTDTDNDGAPDECAQACLDLGMTADADDDGDGVTDEVDAFPLLLAAAIDVDLDGYPDQWYETCDLTCQSESGLVLDNQLNDTDNDGVTNDFDSDNTADNGAPELLSVPSDVEAAVTSEDGRFASVYMNETSLVAYDIVDDNITYQAYLNNRPLNIPDDGYIDLPSGLNVIEWVAVDSSGNQSLSVSQIIKVYPQVKFLELESLTAEGGISKVAIELTGASPEYPVNILWSIEWLLSDTVELDFSESFDMYLNHEVQILEPEEGLPTAEIQVPIKLDELIENDELIKLKLLGVISDNQLIEIFEEYAQHSMVVTHDNLAPLVELKIYQEGVEVKVINPSAGPVNIKTFVEDANVEDQHSYEWDLTALDLTTQNEKDITFSPYGFGDGELSISVSVTDDGLPAKTSVKEISLQVQSPSIEDQLGAMLWMFLLLPFLMYRRR